MRDFLARLKSVIMQTSALVLKGLPFLFLPNVSIKKPTSNATSKYHYKRPFSQSNTKMKDSKFNKMIAIHVGYFFKEMFGQAHSKKFKTIHLFWHCNFEIVTL